MSDAADLNTNGASANGGADGGHGSATVSLPGYVKDNLGKEVYEDLSKRIEKDPEIAKRIPATLPDLFKGWDSAQTELSTSLRRPKEGASKEEWNKFYKELGRPDSPKDYAFSKPELPKGMEYDPKLTDSFAQWAYDEGVSMKSAQGLYNKFVAAQVDSFKAYTDQTQKQEAEADATRKRDLDATRTALRTQWGETYEARMPRNLAALQNPMLIPPSVATKIDQSGLLRDPAFHLWWDRQVAMMSGDRKLGLNREEGEGLEEEVDKDKKSVTDKDGKAHLKEGFFKKTAERNPARKRAV